MALNVISRAALNSSSQSNSVVRQVEEDVYRLLADIAPFVSILRLITHSRAAKMQNRKRTSKIINCENPKFEHQEKDVGTPIAVAAAAYIAGDTDIVVDDADYFAAGDILYNPTTGEQMLVTAVDTATETLTVTRGYGTTAAGAIAISQNLVLLANCFAEGSAANSPVSFATSLPYNYTQIFKEAVEETRTGMQTRHYGHVNKMEELRRDAWEKFVMSRARQYYFGEAKLDTTGTHPKRITAGVNSFITSNVTDLSGSFTYSKFMDFCESVFMFGGTEKLMPVDSELLKAIQLEVLSKSQYMIDEKKSKAWGLDVTKLKTPFGTINLVYDRTLGYFTSGDHGLGFALETDLIEEMVMQPDVWEENIQTPGYDLRKDQVIGEAGLKFRLEKRHGKIIL